jgi:hypothetical protein
MERMSTMMMKLERMMKSPIPDVPNVELIL